MSKLRLHTRAEWHEKLENYLDRLLGSIGNGISAIAEDRDHRPTNAHICRGVGCFGVCRQGFRYDWRHQGHRHEGGEIMAMARSRHPFPPVVAPTEPETGEVLTGPEIAIPEIMPDIEPEVVADPVEVQTEEESDTAKNKKSKKKGPPTKDKQSKGK
jgi:hypothetical protein